MDVVASIVGHGNPSMTRHYTHISTEAKQNALSALPMLETAKTSKGTLEEQKKILHELIDTLDDDKILKILGFVKSLEA